MGTNDYETLPWEEDGEPGFTYSLMLGDDHECETCGFTYNEAELDVHEEGLTFSYRVGCYGGESVTIAEENFDATLDKMLGMLNCFPNWNKEFENKVKEEVDNWYTMNMMKEIRDWKMGK